jgi:hypothetical protein
MAALACIFVATSAWLWRHRMNGDLSWYVHCAQEMLRGATLYRDVIENNPPLAILFYVPIVGLAQVLRVSPAIVLYAGLFAAVIFVLIHVNRTLGTAALVSAAGRGWILLVITSSALLADPGDFGERDPLAALLLVPMVFCYAARLRGWQPKSASPVLAAGAAALAISLKPYFALPWILVSAWFALQFPLRRALKIPEVWLVPILAIAATSATLLPFPDYAHMVADSLRYYAAYDNPLIFFAPLLLTGIVTGVAILWKPRAACVHLIRLSAAAAMGFALSALLQHKGFRYHLAAAEFWTLLTAGFLFWDLLARFKFRQRSMVTLGAALAILVASIHSVMLPVPPISPVDTYVRQHAGAQAVMPFTTDLWIAFPVLVEAGGRDVMPSPSLYQIPTIYQDQVRLAASQPETPARYHTPGAMRPDERELIAQIAGILRSARPAILLVDNRRFKQAFGLLRFDFIDYFSTDDTFRAEMRNYVPGPGDARSRLYVRRASPGSDPPRDWQ